MTSTDDEARRAEDEYYDTFADGDCWNCAGTGEVADCPTDYECVDPEGGCHFCMRRCDVCQPVRRILTDQPNPDTRESA